MMFAMFVISSNLGFAKIADSNWRRLLHASKSSGIELIFWRILRILIVSAQLAQAALGMSVISQIHARWSKVDTGTVDEDDELCEHCVSLAALLKAPALSLCELLEKYGTWAALDEVWLFLLPADCTSWDRSWLSFCHSHSIIPSFFCSLHEPSRPSTNLSLSVL